MRQPLMLVGLLYIAGIATGNDLSLPLGWLFSISFLFGALSLRAGRLSPWALGLFLFFAGWTNITRQNAILSPQDLRVLVADNPEYVTVRGVLAEMPKERLHELGERQIHRSLATVEVEAIGRKDRWEPATGRLLASTSGVLNESFYTGQTVEIDGVIATPPSRVAEGLFDYRAYLATLGIYYQLRVESTNDWRIRQTSTSPTGPPLADRFSRWANATLGFGLPVEDEYVNLQRAMALGWKTGLTGEVAEPFMRSGTIYLFAISGLHVALIAGMLLVTLRSCLVPRAYCGLIIIPLLWFYTAATGWPTSAIRATTMMTIVVGGWTLMRPSNLINSLFVAAFALLLWEPRQLFQTGFQLSFLVVLVMGLLLPKTDQVIQAWLRPDPLLPVALLPRWRRGMFELARFVAGHFSVSLSCWLGSLPLTAYYFHLFTPASLLTSLLIVPLAAFSLMASLGSVICGAWFSQATELFNYAGWFSMVLMTKTCTWVSALPAAWRSVTSPTVTEIGLYYALLIFAFSEAWRTRWKRKWTVISAGTLLLIGLHYGQGTAGEERLTILAVGGGDAIFYEAGPPAKQLLIDCGNESATHSVVTPFLRSRGIDHLPQLLLTHGDIRHVGGTEIMRQEFSVDQILTSAVKSRSAPYRRIIASLEKTPEHWRQVQRGDQIGPWKILHPQPEDHFAQGDDNALVLGGQFQGTRVLLVSDLGQPGQRALMNRESDLHADIVVTGIPAKGEPLDDAFLDVIKPRMIVVSCANVPTQERATKALRERLAQRHIPVYYTSEVNSVTLIFSEKGWLVDTMKDSVNEAALKSTLPPSTALKPESEE